MEDQSFYKALQTGVSDGTHSGNRGLQENYARQARVAHEANKLGQNLVLGVVALFLHPRFCFVGFWLVGFGLLIALPPVIGLSDSSLNGLPQWYGWTAAAVPLVLAILLRKIVRKLMLGVFIVGCAALVAYMAVDIANDRKERAAGTGAPPAVGIQRGLIEASRPGVTSTPPEEGNLFTDAYCGASVPAAERPDWCP